MSDTFSGEKPDDIPQSEWDASIAFKNRVDVASMSACEFIARARMDASAEEREACARIADPIAPDGPMSDYEKQCFDLRDVISQAIRNRKGA